MRNHRRFTHTLFAILLALSPAAAWAQDFGRLECEEACHAEGMEAYNEAREDGWSERRATMAGARVFGLCMQLTCQGPQ